MINFNKLSSRYIWIGLTISVLLMAVAYAGLTLAGTLQHAVANVLIGFCFYMFVTLAEAFVWRRVVSTSPDSLPTFFMGVSGVRLMLALVVMFVYYLVVGRDAMLPFFFVFAVFYIAQLIHHSYFFSHVSRLADDSLN